MGCRRGSDTALLWLWCRLAAAALVGLLGWEPLYATGAAQEKAKRQKKKKRKKMLYLNIHKLYIDTSIIVSYILYVI